MGKIQHLKVKVETRTSTGDMEQATISFVSSGCKLFFNMQHIIIEMKTLEISFLLFLAEKMDGDNIILIDRNLKVAFVAFIHEITSGKAVISPRSVGGYVTRLKKLLLILPTDSPKSGMYLVNPKHIYTGKETDRAKLLKATIEYRDENGLGLAGLINTTEANFYYR